MSPRPTDGSEVGTTADDAARPGPGPVRAGHGVLFVVRHGAGDWSATWCDLGSVALVGPRDEVLAWASAQPAAEHLLQLPEQPRAPEGSGSEHVELRSDRSRAALQRWTT